MPLLRAKLLVSSSKATAQSDIAAFMNTVAGTPTATAVRAVRTAAFLDPRKSKAPRIATLLVYGGANLPASGAKVNPVSVVISDKSKIVAAQADIDAVLAGGVHQTVTTGNANSNPGDIVVGSNLFEAEDVGRSIQIGAAKRTITAYTSATRVTYSGTAISGTGLTVSLLGAEHLQDVDFILLRDDDNDDHFITTFVLGGEAY